MHHSPHQSGSLFGPGGSRKYLNVFELRRFVAAALRAPPKIRLFCLLLRWTGARISEVLALVPRSIDYEAGVVSIVTLKRRKPGIVRQVPIPPWLVTELTSVFKLKSAQRDPHLAARRLWRWSRTTAWRYVKAIMIQAGIVGMQAMPKGLRHGFGVGAIRAKVPLTLLQRWLGHASLRSTAVYLDVSGAEEQEIARRMWRGL
ncbi:site-specific integrase [Bradyrhizobium sp. CCGUVB1N3]|uniref:tyrosine-type recombinase/integrase n=1 Tax=Bradyrhizobium sp. CCGUVB1N3 TaxID=2949629 RepID=UPI0020B36B07|nr:tyrosine-type recombinase/integrase [Bradyrhizobium sp. CCGUVB1N3]MCP3476684.1 site-specific integrase [Bradyrhizobium sp. CCGUVB1N3]